MENNHSQGQEALYSFDFTHVIEQQIDAYLFKDDAQKKEFMSRLRKMVEWDEILWRDIVLGIEILSDDIAREMNLQETD